MNTSLPTNVTAGTPNLPGMLNESHDAMNTLSRDTGWHDLSSLLINGWEASLIRVRRQNDITVFRIQGLRGGSGKFLSSSGALSLSNRFGSGGPTVRSAVVGGTGGNYYLSQTSGGWYCNFDAGTTSTGTEFQWFIISAGAAWPSTLPSAA